MRCSTIGLTGRLTGLTVSLLFAAVACGPPEPSLTTRPSDLAGCTGNNFAIGIDVSSYQTSVNWQTVLNDGYTFAYAKATEGLTIQDPLFPTYWPAIKSAGLIRGAYHLFHPGDNGTTQADDFLSYVGTIGQPGDLPPMLDWELMDSSTASEAITQAQAFIDEIQARTGMTTVIYTYLSFWTSDLGSPSQFAQYPLWMALPAATCPTIPAPWSTWLFWQYDVTSPVSGVVDSQNQVDHDFFNGTLAQLQQLAGMGDGGAVGPPDAGTPPTADAGSPTIDAGVPLLSEPSGNQAMTVVNWTDGHMELFGLGSTGNTVHTWTSGTGDSWAAPASLGSGAECGSAAAFWGGSWLYPELFSPMAAGGTDHLWWSGLAWTSYASYGSQDLSNLATLTWSDGHVSVFGLGTNGAVWENYWSTTASNWTGFSSLGGTSFVAGPVAIPIPGNGATLFATDANGGLWRSAATATSWAAWTQIDGAAIASSPFPVRWPDGHLSVYARGTDDLLYYADLSDSVPSLSPVDSSTAIAGNPSALMNPSGAIVFARGTNGEVLQSVGSADGASYSSLSPLGGQVIASDPFGWLRADGNDEVFGIDASGNLVRAFQTPQGPWQAWGTATTGFSTCASVTPPAPDAGVVRVPDAGSVVPGVDAGTDGGMIVLPQDAGVTGSPDSGGAEPDSGSPGTDAAPKMDAGGTGQPDSGSSQMNDQDDAGTDDDGTLPQPGCSSAGGGSPLYVALGALALMSLRRRRTRSRVFG